MSTSFLKCIKGVLLDITGVLCDYGENGACAIEGSVDAVARLRAANYQVRYVTNETQIPPDKIAEKLETFGFKAYENEVFSPIPATIRVLKERNLIPHLLVHDDVRSAFKEFDLSKPNCVVVGDAGEHFSYENVDEAFQLLMELEKPVLLGMGKGKYYRLYKTLHLDVGAYLAALEYACNIKAEVLGKPSLEFFNSAVQDINVQPHEIVMIGDDIAFDIGGAQDAGIHGMLVRTGKFRPSDEKHPTIKPDVIVDNLANAVDLILGSC